MCLVYVFLMSGPITLYAQGIISITIFIVDFILFSFMCILLVSSFNKLLNDYFVLRIILGEKGISKKIEDTDLSLVQNLVSKILI